MKKIIFTLLFILFISIVVSPSFAEEMKITNPELISAIDEYEAGNYTAAEKLLLKVKESKLDNKATHYFLGLTYKELLKYDKAISNLEVAAEGESSLGVAFYDLAEIYFHLDRAPEALEHIEKAEKAGVKPGHTAFLKGLIFMSQKNFRSAIEAFNIAKRKDPELAENVEYQKNIANDKLGKLDEKPE